MLRPRSTMFALAAMLALAACDKPVEQPGGASDRSPQGELIRKAEADIAAATQAAAAAPVRPAVAPEPRTQAAVERGNIRQ